MTQWGTPVTQRITRMNLKSQPLFGSERRCTELLEQDTKETDLVWVRIRKRLIRLKK